MRLLKSFLKTMRAIHTEEAGNDMLEYGFILVLIAIAAYAAVRLLGLNIAEFFNYVASLF